MNAPRGSLAAMRDRRILGLFLAFAVAGCGMPKSAAPPPPPPNGSGAKEATTRGVTLVDPPKETVVQAEEAEDEASSSGPREKGDPNKSVEDAEGEGGLGMSGSGKGGGGTGEGIGLGSIGTIGHGAGSGSGSGYGSGAGGGQTKGRVAAATATTSGSGLAQEVIARVVRGSLGQMTSCYEKAMTKSPTLQGKVAVKFTIDGKGAVLSAAPGDTNITDAEMVTCVVAAVKRMSFPAPDGGGVVVVTYPFVFAPRDL